MTDAGFLALLQRDLSHAIIIHNQPDGPNHHPTAAVRATGERVWEAHLLQTRRRDLRLQQSVVPRGRRRRVPVR